MRIIWIQPENKAGEPKARPVAGKLSAILSRMEPGDRFGVELMQGESGEELRIRLEALRADIRVAGGLGFDLEVSCGD